jgi:hypothetical protein
MKIISDGGVLVKQGDTWDDRFYILYKGNMIETDETDEFKTKLLAPGDVSMHVCMYVFIRVNICMLGSKYESKVHVCMYVFIRVNLHAWIEA